MLARPRTINTCREQGVIQVGNCTSEREFGSTIRLGSILLCCIEKEKKKFILKLFTRFTMLANGNSNFHTVLERYGQSWYHMFTIYIYIYISYVCTSFRDIIVKLGMLLNQYHRFFLSFILLNSSVFNSN